MIIMINKVGSRSVNRNDTTNDSSSWFYYADDYN